MQRTVSKSVRLDRRACGAPGPPDGVHAAGVALQLLCYPKLLDVMASDTRNTRRRAAVHLPTLKVGDERHLTGGL
jgi:hypothetical protein